MQYLLGSKSRTLLKLVFSIFLLHLILRLAFFYSFKHTGGDYDFHELLQAFYLGLKFDMRVSLVLALPLALLAWLLPPNRKGFSRKFWLLFYTGVLTLYLLGYYFDFGYYSYLQFRINGTIKKFLFNPLISIEMVSESYPVGWLLFSLLVMSLLFFQYLRKFVFASQIERGPQLSRKQKIITTFFLFLVYTAGLHAKFSQYPLRWSEAFFSNNNFIAAMSLNPWHYFIDTYKANTSSYDLEKTKEHYQEVAKYLGVQDLDPEKLNFKRPVRLTPLIQTQPNIVVIVMESLASYKTSLQIPDLDTTPHVRSLAKNGYYFSQFYVPSEGTARSMFTFVTGIPDVTSYRTSSRNPLIVNQNTLINAFKNYEKYYFLGGSANWGEIRGIISHNIKDVHVIEEGMYDSPRTDVWGISDYHLMKETVKKLSQRNSAQPFFAIIQTAGFHRPYTIPEDHGSFEAQELSEEQVQKYGFVSNDEYNALRFSDFALGHFFELIKDNPQFQNTLFVIFGDHGLPDNQAQHLPKGIARYKLERFHVPFILYAPDLIVQPKTFDKVATEPDVLPTLVGLTGHPYTNTTMGRNLLAPEFDSSRYALHFVYYTDPKRIGLIGEKYYLLGDSQNGLQGIYEYKSDHPDKNLKDELPEDFQRLSRLTQGLYETSKYMLYHNPNLETEDPR